MEMFFLKLLNLSINASILVAAVLLFRLVFKKAPKWINCLLWALVGIRLIIPFSFESSVSLIPKKEPIPATIIYQVNPQVAATKHVVNEYASSPLVSNVTSNGSKTSTLLLTISIIWIIGLVLMLFYSLISYLRLRSNLMTATLYSKGVKQSDRIASPFVLGIIKPMIYIPYSIKASDMEYVIAHEKTHIRRKDYLWKPIGFLILSIYWFNPVMWIAYILLCKDIEAACDEKVISKLDDNARKGYLHALLNCSVKQRSITACPVAFGENDVKRRVKGIKNYKKPAFWVIAIAVIACIVVGICFITNPRSDKKDAVETSKTNETIVIDTTDISTKEAVSTQDTDAISEDVTETTNVTEADNEDTDDNSGLEIILVIPNSDQEVTNLLGYTDWEYEISDIAGVHHTVDFYSKDDHTLLGSWFGFSTNPIIYIVDIDGDGINEMISNVQYGADGVIDVCIFHNNNGVIEEWIVRDTTVCEAFNVEQEDICPLGIVSKVYDPETNTIKMTFDGIGEASVELNDADAFFRMEYTY